MVPHAVEDWGGAGGLLGPPPPQAGSPAENDLPCSHLSLHPSFMLKCFILADSWVPIGHLALAESW